MTWFGDVQDGDPVSLWSDTFRCAGGFCTTRTLHFHHIWIKTKLINHPESNSVICWGTRAQRNCRSEGSSICVTGVWHCWQWTSSYVQLCCIFGCKPFNFPLLCQNKTANDASRARRRYFLWPRFSVGRFSAQNEPIRETAANLVRKHNNDIFSTSLDENWKSTNRVSFAKVVCSPHQAHSKHRENYAISLPVGRIGPPTTSRRPYPLWVLEFTTSTHLNIWQEQKMWLANRSDHRRNETSTATG